jgi:TPR repeat protein
MSESEKQTALIPLQHIALTKVGAKSLVARGHVDLSNNEEAEAWFNKGMASYRQQRYDDVLHCFQHGIQLNPNHPLLLHNLGSLYYEDHCGMKDNVEAAKWFRKSAEQGCIDCQAQLGLCYSYGIGVLEDHVEAAVWWKKAAEQGHRGAQSVLGSFYDKGKGAPQDYWQAVFWYLKAAEQGDKEAKADLTKMQMRNAEPHNNSLQKWMSEQQYSGFSPGEFKQALTEFKQLQAKAVEEAEQADE